MSYDADLERAYDAGVAAERERIRQLAIALGAVFPGRGDDAPNYADFASLLNTEQLCPEGCGCRYGTDDADRRECGCDGPCTEGWR